MRRAKCSAGAGRTRFRQTQADLAKAMLSLPATKGFEIGSGFSATRMCGSEHNDAFEKRGGRISTRTNFSGGIQGGISNGEEIYFRVAFKPTATIAESKTVSLPPAKRPNLPHAADMIHASFRGPSRW